MRVLERTDSSTPMIANANNNIMNSKRKVDERWEAALLASALKSPTPSVLLLLVGYLMR